MYSSHIPATLTTSPSGQLSLCSSVTAEEGKPLCWLAALEENEAHVVHQFVEGSTSKN